jgi:hypothetical protein
MPAGYSGRSAADKLGIKPGLRVTVLDAPGDYHLLVDGLPESWEPRLLDGPADLVHLFVTRQADLQRRIGEIRSLIAPDGVLWVSWPKRASKLPTDLTEDGIRRIALEHRLVDVKVCAVNEVWSALKLVVPVADRRP